MKIEKSVLNTPAWAKGQRELASIAGISLPTISKYMQMPGAPMKRKKGYNVEACMKWIAQVAESEKVMGKAGSEMQGLKQQEVGLRCQKLAFELAVTQQKYVLKEERDRDIRTAMQIFRQNMTSLPSRLAAPFGAIGPEIEASAEQAIEETLIKMSEELRLV